MAPSVFATLPQYLGAPPPSAQISMPGAPPVFADGPAPQVTQAPPSPIEQQVTETSRRLKDLQGHDTYDYSQHGKLRNIGHVLSKIGNVAGDIFAPSTMALVPGTDLNRQVQEGSLSARLQSLAQEQAENEQRQAGTARTEAETKALPQEEADKHGASSAATREANAKADALENAPAPVQSLATGHAYAVDQAIKAGHDPATDPIVKHYEEAIRSTVPGFNKEPKLNYETTVGADGKPHTYALDEKGNKVADEGVHYERPVTVNVGQERAAKNDVLKAYQPTLDAAQRMNIMTDNYEKAVKDHDQQAMLSLLANHIGMTLGAQKGARITKDILHEAQESTPWLQGLTARYDKDGVLSGVTLTPGQMRQMVGLGQSMYAESSKKSRSAAQYLGSQDDGPQRVPGTSTIRYYMGLANGDAAKAKQLAADDGWSVK